jgi:hypothetical protein
MHNNSTESGVTARVGSDGGVGCATAQLLPGVGRRFKVDLRTRTSGHPDVMISCVRQRRPSSAVVPCLCVSETVRPIDVGV